MKLKIQARPFALTGALEAHIRSKLKSAFSRLQVPVTSVSIALSNINGSRGGKDKECLVQLSLPGIGLIVIKDTQVDLYHAIDSAVQRARHAVSRSVARRRHFKNTAVKQLRADNLELNALQPA